MPAYFFVCSGPPKRGPARAEVRPDPHFTGPMLIYSAVNVGYYGGATVSGEDPFTPSASAGVDALDLATPSTLHE